MRSVNLDTSTLLHTLDSSTLIGKVSRYWAEAARLISSSVVILKLLLSIIYMKEAMRKYESILYDYMSNVTIMKLEDIIWHWEII